MTACIVASASTAIAATPPSSPASLSRIERRKRRRRKSLARGDLSKALLDQAEIASMGAGPGGFYRLNRSDDRLVHGGGNTSGPRLSDDVSIQVIDLSGSSVEDVL